MSWALPPVLNFKYLFYLFEQWRNKERSRQRYTICWFAPQMLHQPGLGQANVRSPELPAGLMAGRDLAHESSPATSEDAQQQEAGLNSSTAQA